MKRTINKIWNAVTTIILVILMLIAAVIFVPKFFGLEPLIVLSGSMEPTYPTGSLLYVKSIKQEDVKEEVPITFYLEDGTLATHRVIEVTAEGTFRTQGDANDVADGGAVEYKNILGTPVAHVPKLGYLADKLSSTTGKIIYGSIVISIIILMLMGDYLFAPVKKKEEVEEKTDEIE